MHTCVTLTLKIPFKNKNRIFSFIFLEKKIKGKSFQKHTGSERLSCSRAALRVTAPTTMAPWDGALRGALSLLTAGTQSGRLPGHTTRGG